MPRFPLLLATTVLGTGAALLVGRAALLTLHPPLTPALDTTSLEMLQRWDPDPWRRREAALLLHARAGSDPRRGRQLLRQQGWGRDPLAAVVLKQDALAAQALGDPAAPPLWRQLQQRFPGEASSADALYALGREKPALRKELRRRFPAHPAALAAALEQTATPADRLEGATHLARWGARWPGAAARLQQACGQKQPAPGATQRDQLAGGLAQLGRSQAALRCLGATTGSAATELSLGEALLKGSPEEQRQGERRLLALVRRSPDAPQAEAAVRSLSEHQGSLPLLEQLPPRWRGSAPVQARLAHGRGGTAALAVLQRWPGDPASWDLQWDLAREALLQGRWQQAATLLEAIRLEQLPPPLAARSAFWLNEARARLGQRQQAVEGWRALRQRWPGGYYDWRAAARLGDPAAAAVLEPMAAAPEGSGEPWWPLESGDPRLDTLWRLDQRLEAWEQWRHLRPPGGEADPRLLLVEGRLRQGVGDDWTGLGQLELAALRLTPDPCGLQPLLERSLHPRRFLPELEAAAQPVGLPPELLLAVARQESRLTPTVHSPVGAAGLLQLLPSTASELAGRPLSSTDLEDPALNARLGALYLQQLSVLWQGDPIPLVASYNAGPGAVGGWLQKEEERRRLKQEPELWVEAIPYPETRLYVKKVLGNLWSYRRADAAAPPRRGPISPGCPASVLSAGPPSPAG
ncbi:MAG: transglycosylase SLT domain-containing protein [Prochlorococcaceae cyanobacterium]|jgi:soluble lytic murein transglycosylase